jgi:hypothetical protein
MTRLLLCARQSLGQNAHVRRPFALQNLPAIDPTDTTASLRRIESRIREGNS